MKNTLTEEVQKAKAIISATAHSTNRIENQRFFKKAFEALVDAVEVKKAAKEEWFAQEYNHFYPGRRTGFLWLTRRSKAAGLAYLRFEGKLDAKTTQGAGSYAESGMNPQERAEAARAVMSLYLWWTEKRINRPDPMVVSGLAALSEKVKSPSSSSARYVCEHSGLNDPFEAGQESHEDQACSSCLMTIGLAQQRAEELLYAYELEDQTQFSNLARVPMKFLSV